MLAHCAFIQDLKPRQIVQAYPLYWSHGREVSIALYRIRRLLRTDLEIQQLRGQLGEPSSGSTQDSSTPALDQP